MVSNRSVRWWWSGNPDEALESVASDLERGLPIDGAKSIKSSDRRCVDALPGVSGGLLLKSFEVSNSESLKYRFRPSRARSEYRMARALAQRGVPVPEALGYGEERDGRRLLRAWFIGRLVPDARTVGDGLRAASKSGDAVRVGSLVRGALDVVAELHRHPYLHRDLHANNFLLAADDRVILTDLHSVWRVPRLTRSMRVANLARLLFSMRGAVDLRCVSVFLTEHAERRHERPELLVIDVLAAIDAFERNYVRGRTNRCLKGSTLFVRERADSGWLFRRRDYSVDQFEADLQMHAEVLADGGTSVLGRSPAGCVTRVGRAPDGRVVKEYGARGRFQAIRQWVGAGRARSAWVGARRLEVLGVPTPRALALHERSDGSSVLVMELLRDQSPLRALAERTPAGLSPKKRAALSRALGHLVGRLARAGVLHDDLSSKNVLVGKAPPPSSRDLRTQPQADWPCVQLIDLDNMTSMPPHDPVGLQRMLSQLCDLPEIVSRTDRMRFLQGFAAAAGRALPRDVGEASLAGARDRAARRAAARPAMA